MSSRKKDLEAEDSLYILKGCKFFVETNNLISIHLVQKILDEFGEEAIVRLNKVLKGMKFFVGGYNSHSSQTGFLNYSSYDYDLNDMSLTFYLFNILPFIGGLLSGRRDIYAYLPRSIEEFPKPEGLKQTMEGVGLKDVQFYPLTWGITWVHVGIKG